MKQTDVNFRKITHEFAKHISKRLGYKKMYNKKRRQFLKRMLNKEEV